MRGFLYHIFLIIAITIGFMIVLDKAYSYAFQNGIIRTKVQKVFQDKNKHYSLAFFGSSRTESHIDCELIEQITGETCINYGIPGGSARDILLLMSISEANNVNFDKVFIQVDSDYNSLGFSNGVKSRLMPFLGNSLVKEALTEEKDLYYNKIIPFYSYLKYDYILGFREFLCILIGKEPKLNLDYGLRPYFGEGNNLKGKVKDLKDIDNKYLENITALNLKTNTTTKFFTAPYSGETKNKKTFKLLEEKLPNYIDLSHIFNENPQYFSDSGHLNYEGAKVFSRVMIDTLLID